MSNQPKTKIYREAERAVREWWAKNQNHRHRIHVVRHIYPRAYVLARAAPCCLMVASPWQDGEPQLYELDSRYGATNVHLFDESLRAGSWCVLAYVRTEGAGEHVAVPLPDPRKTR